MNEAHTHTHTYIHRHTQTLPYTDTDTDTVTNAYARARLTHCRKEAELKALVDTLTHKRTPDPSHAGGGAQSCKQSSRVPTFRSVNRHS